MECHLLVTFHLRENKSLLISRKITKPYCAPLCMQNCHIAENDSNKHLGIYFSSDCLWHQLISIIKEKAWSRINAMRKLKFILDRKSLETNYFTFIRAILEYGDVVWNNCSQYEKDEFEKIQIQAARIAIGTTKLNASFNETQWKTQQQRCKKMTKIVSKYNQEIPQS